MSLPHPTDGNRGGARRVESEMDDSRYEAGHRWSAKL